MLRHVFLMSVCVWMTVAGARAELQIVNVEAVQGALGPLREGLGIYAQEELVFRFLVTGLDVDEEGNADVLLTRTILDSQGRVIDSDSTPTKGVLALGGGTMPGTATVTFSPGSDPGVYQFIVHVKDSLSGEEAEFQRDISIRPDELAIINPRFSLDAEAVVSAPAGGFVGQILHFRFLAIGFDRTRGKIDLEMNVQLFDTKGLALMPQPIQAELVSEDADVVADAPYVTFSGQMALNRAGNFQVEIVVTDRSSGEEVKFVTPFVVREP